MTTITTRMRVLALTLATCWTAAWTLFAVASAASEVIGNGRLFSVEPVVIVIVLLVGVATAWRWSSIGGVFFITFGLILLWACFYFFHNSPATTWLLVLTLSLPPLMAGVLFLGDVWQRRLHHV